MRKLIAVISILATAFTVLVFGLSSPAAATVTSPGNGAVLRGNATLSETGGFDDSTFDHCSWFGGSGGDTRLQLINSGGGIVFEQFWNTGGARSVTIDTRNYPNGSYTVRGTITVRKNGGFAGLGCSNETRVSNVLGDDRQHHRDLAVGAGVRPAEHHDPGLRNAGGRQRQRAAG